MEQLLGLGAQQQQQHQPHRSQSPRTPTRPHLQHIPSNRVRDHHHAQPHAAAALKILRITPPFFLILLAAVYLLASFTILSAPASSSLRATENPNRLVLPMAAPASPSRPPSPEIFELDNGRMRARISNVGATVTSLLVPDKNGVLGDVVLGFDSLDPYLVPWRGLGGNVGGTCPGNGDGHGVCAFAEWSAHRQTKHMFSLLDNHI